MIRPKALNSFSTLIKSGNLHDLSLTIYYVSPFVFTNHPWSVDDLIRECEGQEIVVDGSDLGKYIDLLNQIGNTALIPVLEKSSYLDARIYYVFETEKRGKIFDVAMWSSDGGIFVSGLEVKGTNIFYDVITPFLSEDAVKTLKNG